MTGVTVLTPAGTGAIATVAVQGAEAWSLARKLFQPMGRQTLPELPPLHRFWFGKLVDGDEVVLSVREVEPILHVEVHCHGGRHVVRWVVEQFTSHGAIEQTWWETPKPGDGSLWAFEALEWMTRATTMRTAAILLDQSHGAFEVESRAIEALITAGDHRTAMERLEILHTLIPLGRHLIDPWRVVLAGPPNVGKSSLLNALAGFQRSVVSATAGTTRDVVTVPAAFEGWPVELADTAGLRRAAESLEAEGIERARNFLANADLVVWLLDASEAEPVLPGDDIPAGSQRIVVLNKCDVQNEIPASGELRVSAKTGEGVPELVAAIARRLVPCPPTPGAAVPFLESQFAWIEDARNRCNCQ